RKFKSSSIFRTCRTPVRESSSAFTSVRPSISTASAPMRAAVSKPCLSGSRRLASCTPTRICRTYKSPRPIVAFRGAKGDYQANPTMILVPIILVLLAANPQAGTDKHAQATQADAGPAEAQTATGSVVFECDFGTTVD